MVLVSDDQLADCRRRPRLGPASAAQIIAKKPVIRMRLLLDRQYAAVVAMVTVGGMVIYGSAYIIPQFLLAISNYNAFQAGGIVRSSIGTN